LSQEPKKKGEEEGEKRCDFVRIGRFCSVESVKNEHNVKQTQMDVVEIL